MSEDFCGRSYIEEVVAVRCICEVGFGSNRNSVKNGPLDSILGRHCALRCDAILQQNSTLKFPVVRKAEHDLHAQLPGCLHHKVQCFQGIIIEAAGASLHRAHLS